MANNKQLHDWKDAPEWAKYRAVDKNGDMFYYEKVPSPGNEEWYNPQDGVAKNEFAGTFDWRESLEQRPENTAKMSVIMPHFDREFSDDYPLWDYLHNELGVIALDSQLGDIIEIVRRIEQKRKEQ